MNDERDIRKTVTLNVLVLDKRRQPIGRDVRLYDMKPHQRRLFDDSVSRMALEQNWHRANAERAVEDLIARLMLDNEGPIDGAPSYVHRLSMAFPRMTADTLTKLPRLGCPEGWIAAICIPIASSRQPAAPVRVKLLRMLPPQQVAFNDAIAGIEACNGVGRDAAHAFALKTVGAISCGAAVIGDESHEVLRDLAEHFTILSEDDVDALPDVTEDDVRRWAFTTADVGETPTDDYGAS